MTSVYDNGGIIGKAIVPGSSSAGGFWSQAAQYDAARTNSWPKRDYTYFNGFEGTTVANSEEFFTGDFVGTLDILQDNGSISTADKYAGSKSYYGNSRPSPNYRLAFGIDPANINVRRYFTIEFYLKCVSFDSFATTFHLQGGGANEIFYFRSNRSSIFAAGIGATTMDNNSGWCTWTNWNKFSIRIDRGSATNNGTISVNDSVKYTGTVPQSWTAYTAGKTIISFYQFYTSAASDNGVEAYIDNLRIASTNE